MRAGSPSVPDRYGPATRIISGCATVIGPSAVRPVVDRPRWRRTRPQRADALCPELLHIRGTAVQVVDPLAEPRLQCGFVTRQRIPVEVEPVVAVVDALDIGGMRAPRLDDDRVDDK